MSAEASMYVGMHADMDIHRAAKSYTLHLRWAMVVGAMSGLISGLWLSRTASTSTSSPDAGVLIVQFGKNPGLCPNRWIAAAAPGRRIANDEYSGFQCHGKTRSSI